MYISDMLASGKVTLSCEIFPPKRDKPIIDALGMVAKMAKSHPAFISVTCGAGGSTGGNTVEMARAAQENGVTALAHMTCVSTSPDEIDAALDNMCKNGISNVLALRGDIPEGASPEDYSHASDLIDRIRRHGGFCIGGACYPEGHPESKNLTSDIESLYVKQESGCQFLTTQMFFDNNILYNFMFRLLKRGVHLPIVAGIMPVTNARQIKRIISISQTALPSRFRMIVDRFQDDPSAMRQAGIAYATDQIIDLIANGVNNVHIYTMNNPDVAAAILANLSEIVKSN